MRGADTTHASASMLYLYRVDYQVRRKHKAMKASTKRILNFALIIGTLLLVFILGFSNNELQSAGDVLKAASPVWLALCVLAYGIFLFLDGLSVYYFLRRQKHPVTLRYAFYVGVMGQYYSSITPGASGGQPMQVYYLKKKQVPLGVASSALTVKFFSYQLMVMIMATVFWILKADVVTAQLQGASVTLLIAGYVIHSFSVVLVLLLAVSKPLVRFIIAVVIKVGAKLRLIKHPSDAVSKSEGILSSFHASVTMLRSRPGELLVMLLINGLQALCYMAVPAIVHHALGLSGTDHSTLLAMAIFLYLSASYMPLPGASGAQEGGFMLFFKGMFPAGTIFMGMLIWRFVTYYLLLIGGAVITVIQAARGLRKGKKEKLDED